MHDGLSHANLQPVPEHISSILAKEHWRVLLTHSSISCRLRVSVIEAVVKTFTAMARHTQSSCREKGHGG